MPLFGDERSSGDMFSSYRGPRGAAAQMCAAVPMLISLWPSDVAPTVGVRQGGYEQSQPARFAIWSLVFSAKSSLFFFIAKRLGKTQACSGEPACRPRPDPSDGC